MEHAALLPLKKGVCGLVLSAGGGRVGCQKDECFGSKVTPLKNIEYPLKIDGWKMYSLPQMLNV